MSKITAENELFHFTKSNEILLSILQNGFYPRCAVEDYSFILTQLKKEEAKMAIPMVCFCDLPEHLQFAHKNKYGRYGIALKKDWCIEQGICPILYILDNSKSNTLYSHLASNLLGLIKLDVIRHNMRNNNTILSYFEEAKGALIDFTGFMKRYKENDVLNYDDREWRYLVPFYDANNPINVNKHRVNRLISNDITPKNIEGLNKRMEKEYPLRFKAEHISKIIVPSESQSDNLKNLIDDTMLNDKDLIKSKIIVID